MARYYPTWGTDNEDLMQKLYAADTIKSKEVLSVMLSVDRSFFSKINPYVDAPQYIGYGATISAPHMHAIALENLKSHLVEGETVLDVGSGSGYLTTCMSLMVGKTGKVVGIDHISELVDLAVNNMKYAYSDLLNNQRIIFVVGDGKDGFCDYAPYNAIHVGASVEELPRPLLEQLKIGGRLIIPVGTDDQELIKVDKIEEGKVRCTPITTVAFVPLTTREEQLSCLKFNVL